MYSLAKHLKIKSKNSSQGEHGKSTVFIIMNIYKPQLVIHEADKTKQNQSLGAGDVT